MFFHVVSCRVSVCDAWCIGIDCFENGRAPQVFLRSRPWRGLSKIRCFMSGRGFVSGLRVPKFGVDLIFRGFGCSRRLAASQDYDRTLAVAFGPSSTGSASKKNPSLMTPCPSSPAPSKERKLSIGGNSYRERGNRAFVKTICEAPKCL